jgi:formylglycine-generating enzyme required for sulfatase activity
MSLSPTTRRGFLKFAGFIGVGGASLFPVALIREFFFNNKPVKDKPSSNPNFDVVTVNAQGKEITRTSKQAKFFSEDMSNGITLEMVAIPGGTFLMGSPKNEEDREKYESPQHQVTVKPFFMGKFTITQAQWQAVAALPKVKIDLNPNPSYFKGADRPVEQVSWYDAEEFCARLSQKTGKAYRLPSEAEWEYACRGGTTTPFHFGETITPEIANYNSSDAYGAGPTGKVRKETTPVGSFGVANAFGLYDMHGNVWEWCADAWHSKYGGAPIDGSTWLSSDKGRGRVLRGGSWNDSPWLCRSALRYWIYPDDGGYGIGFRAVCSAE